MYVYHIKAEFSFRPNPSGSRQSQAEPAEDSGGTKFCPLDPRVLRRTNLTWRNKDVRPNVFKVKRTKAEFFKISL